MLVQAELDPSLCARIRSRTPLFYADGADPAEDRPGFVRAASSIVSHRGELVIVQDDAAFLAFIPGPGAPARALALARLEDGQRQHDDRRGNKKLKLDLECALSLEVGAQAVFVAWGSGSTSRRERAAVLDGESDVRVVALPHLYGALRELSDFAGSELNLEGCVQQGDQVLFLQRGNGAPRHGKQPIDALARVEARALAAYLADPSQNTTPAVSLVAQVELGHVQGARLTFTDAASVQGALLYSAAAEASPDVTRDGPVSGVAIGTLGSSCGSARYALLRDERGQLSRDKVEGICAWPAEQASTLLAVVDRDDPLVPSELLWIELEGPFV